jgi:very-short-patch-repair endonuclease
MTRDRTHNQEELKNRRKGLRKKLTPAEATLWLLLKDKKLEGRKFRRQHSVGKYIVDFYCPSEKLVMSWMVNNISQMKGCNMIKSVLII